MAVIVWPSELPQFVARENFRLARPDTRDITPTELGQPRVGRGSSRGRAKATADLFLDYPQSLRFDRFVDEDTGGGALPFLFPAVARHLFPLLGDDLLPLLDYDGSAILASWWWLVQFDTAADLPASVIYGNGWRASMQIEILPTAPVLPT